MFSWICLALSSKRFHCLRVKFFQSVLLSAPKSRQTLGILHQIYISVAAEVFSCPEKHAVIFGRLLGVFRSTCSCNSCFSKKSPHLICIMALVDSRAAFVVHCDKVDSTGWLRRIMEASGLYTFSDLGFAVGTPQTPPTSQEFELFCTGINRNVDMTISEVSRVRRLHFEACTMIIAHTKQQVAGDSALDGVKKLPQAEKQARLVQQQAKLSGISITGELQPSHALIDLAASMLESNAVLWIGPSKCSKRETELQPATKEKPQILSLEQQTLKVVASESNIRVDNSTELQLQWSLQRRGIALDQCGLVEWPLHQRWVQYLLGLTSKMVPDGYQKVRLEQLIKADKELFLIMSEDIQQKNVQLSATPSPMNEAMGRLMNDPRVTMHLLPIPAKSGPSGVATTLKHSAEVDDPPPVKRPKKVKPSSKAKSLCPAELKDYKQRDDKNRTICWAFNLAKGCQEQVSQGRCKKGMHVCIKCGRNNHSLVACRAKS